MWYVQQVHNCAKKGNIQKNNGKKIEQLTKIFLIQKNLEFVEHNYHCHISKIALIFLTKPSTFLSKFVTVLIQDHGSTSESLNDYKLKKVRLTISN